MLPTADPALPASTYAPPRIARPGDGLARWSRRALPIAATCWCSVAVAGQLLLASYVLAFYGRALAAGHPERWNEVMPHGYEPGRTGGNLLVAMHLLFTVVIFASGALQLLPQIRRHAPAIHRWNGRLYVLSALLMGGGGLAMMSTRRVVGDASQHASTMINAALIAAFALLAWRTAVARRFDLHRRWALRLFLVVGGVWFFRLGLSAWLVVNRGPVGFDPKTFEGPFLTALGYAQYLVPLAVLEAYLRVRDHAGPRGRVAMAFALGASTLLTAFGIACAAMILWLPHMA
ncbi:MAG: DUF2306 domain-containing protein [Proteobacteria bacterium]|nr:DUF2306 domain-containing protein [Pseudomonadota bacterium]